MSTSGIHPRLVGDARPSGGEARPQTLRFYTPLNTKSVVAEVLPGRDGEFGCEVELLCVRQGGDLRIYHGEIPADYTRDRRLLRFHCFDSMGSLIRSYPTDGPVASCQTPLFMMDGQFFLYEPPRIFSRPQVESFTFTPAKFRPRRIRVLLPRGYRENRRKKYPVLIAQDGQNLFHPGSHFGSWDLDLTVSRLIGRGEILETIVVAIDNTEDRFQEYTPEYGKVKTVRGRGGEFATMMRDELLPHLRKAYRIHPEPEFTGHMGSSLGGLLGFHVANEFKSAFGVVAALSPSFWVNMTENLARAKRPPASRARIWIDSGCAGINSDGYHNTMKIGQTMMEAGHTIGPRFMHIVGLGHEHNERDWARRCPDILRWMYPPAPEVAPVEPLDENLVLA